MNFGAHMHDTLAGTVEVRCQDGIAILTLTRPTAGNRITQQMAEAGVAALEEARKDRSISGCVLTGDGDVFCMGGGDYRGAGSSSAGRLEFARAHNDLARATSGSASRWSRQSMATLMRAASA